ncbi:DUF3861 domain-containing protein [Shinella pollutisoli]|uniref:DUF3861 domain-containing protein n=1 Tax=Shinella pollutisoli TaxID=2250594 RepID=A0ABV7DAI2_9HYPH|nr:DUF3861 domain-containing protein [Shinella pollutisoli]
MKGNLYRITIDQLEDAKGNSVRDSSLSFDLRNHDDIFVVVQRMKDKALFSEDEATALAIGLKLFGEVMLAHRSHELFKPLLPHFGEFMKELKKGAR